MWNLTFISEEDFTNHVKATIEKYGEKLESFDLKRFNKNIIDPLKLIFDKTVYQPSWEEIVATKSSAKEISLIITILDTSISEFSSILKTVMFHQMVKKVVGM